MISRASTRPCADAQRDLLVLGDRRHALGNQPFHLADRKQRTREGKAIVGQLRHDSSPALLGGG